MIDPFTQCAESRKKERKAWKQIEGGVFSVVLGLAALFFYFLASTVLLLVLMSGALPPAESEGVSISVSVALGLLQVGGFILLVVGRLRCLACPRTMTGALPVSVVFPILSLAAGVLGIFLLFEPVFGVKWNGKAAAFSFAASLLALIISEFCYLRFLDRLSLFVESVSLRQHLEHFLSGSVVVALLIGMTTFGSVVVLSPESPSSSNSAAQFTNAVATGTLIASLGLLVLIGWYCKVAFEAWHAVQVYREKCDVSSAMGLVWAGTESVPEESDRLPTGLKDDDFERFFLEEASQKGEGPPPTTQS